MRRGRGQSRITKIVDRKIVPKRGKDTVYIRRYDFEIPSTTTESLVSVAEREIYFHCAEYRLYCEVN